MNEADEDPDAVRLLSVEPGEASDEGSSSSSTSSSSSAGRCMSEVDEADEEGRRILSIIVHPDDVRVPGDEASDDGSSSSSDGDPCELISSLIHRN